MKSTHIVVLILFILSILLKTPFDICPIPVRPQ